MIQLDFFSKEIEPKTSYDVCLKTLQEAYPNKDNETIKLGIRFAGMPMYEDKKFRDTFFWRVNHYITNLHDKWGADWSGQPKYKGHAIAFKSKLVEGLKLKFVNKEDFNMMYL
jgi:hypothetical protein